MLQTDGPDRPREIRVRQELPRGPSRPRRHQANPFSAMLTHETHGFSNVAVVAHHNAAVLGIEPTVI